MKNQRNSAMQISKQVPARQHQRSESIIIHLMAGRFAAKLRGPTPLYGARPAARASSRVRRQPQATADPGVPGRRTQFSSVQFAGCAAGDGSADRLHPGTGFVTLDRVRGRRMSRPSTSTTSASVTASASVAASFAVASFVTASAVGDCRRLLPWLLTSLLWLVVSLRLLLLLVLMMMLCAQLLVTESDGG